MKKPRRQYNKVGHPRLPDNATKGEIVAWLRELALWQEIQPYGRQMDAREWAATCLNAAAEGLEASP